MAQRVRQHLDFGEGPSERGQDPPAPIKPRCQHCPMTLSGTPGIYPRRLAREAGAVEVQDGRSSRWMTVRTSPQLGGLAYFVLAT
jgi:hypothetical protein